MTRMSRTVAVRSRFVLVPSKNLMVTPSHRPRSVAATVPSEKTADTGSLTQMSTRALILAALLCGLAILVAFTVQVLIAS